MHCSRLACGLTGRWKDEPFQVVARQTYLSPAGYWQEWHLEFGNGETAWLTERDGVRLLREELELPPTLPGLDGLVPGATCDLFGEPFVVTLLRGGALVHSEGRPTEQVPSTLQVVEFESREALLRLDRTREGGRLFLAHRLTLPDLQLVDSSAAEAASEAGLSQLVCPSCSSSATVARTALAYVACPACGARVDGSTQPPRIVQQGSTPGRRGRRDAPPAPTLALGATGTLFGADYTVLGAVQRQCHVSGTNVELTEYHLFSPREGVLQLLQSSDGTWWGVESCSTPVYNTSDAWLDGTRFSHAHSQAATVAWAQGNLPWLALEGDSQQEMEFALDGLGGGMREGTRLVRQLRKDALRWVLLQPLDADTILDAFCAEAPDVPVAKAQPQAVTRTRVTDLKGPLRLAAWGNAALWLANPDWLTLAVTAVTLAGLVSMAGFSWLFEGERL